jgi:hypothetical protein
MTSLGKALLAVLFGTAQVNAFVVQGPSRSQSRLASSVDDLPIDAKLSKDIWRSVTPTVIQGNSMRTFKTTSADRVQVLLKTEGRPLNTR